MSDEWSYSDEELNEYFQDASRRRADESGDPSGDGGASHNALRRFFDRRFDPPDKAYAAYVLSILTGIVLLGTLLLGGYMLTLTDNLPSTQSLENPQFQLATVAYTADGEELARYARQNRSWMNYDEISPHVIDALLATEDHRFHQHWGIDLQGIAAAVVDIMTGNFRGASTISQQLARNLYNEQIGRAVSIERKLKEMVTAVKLERRYTKREIVEMYLNTVEFGNNAFGIQSAARTFYGKDASELNVLESATLVGMLKGVTLYNPVRNPERSKARRNVVLQQMVRNDKLSASFYEENSDEPVDAEYYSSELYASMAPYFAEHVRQWLEDWSEESGHDPYADGLRVYTTLDSDLQKIARASVDSQMTALQNVVGYEWSRSLANSVYSTELPAYFSLPDHDPFSYFWTAEQETVYDFIRQTDHYEHLRDQGLSENEALTQLYNDESFADSLRAEKMRLEAGLVSLDPRNGHVKVWIGGRDFRSDKYDKVATARRQPGSTFKPFTYTAAIDNGYSPYYQLLDSTFTWEDPAADTTWSPTNFGGSDGQMYTLSQGLAHSKNTITGRLVLEVGPGAVAFYANRMGIKSPLAEVPSIALGTSNVTLLEMTSAYSTLASGGMYYEPTVVTRIEDRYGNLLYQSTPAPREALSEQTAYTMVDMLRGVIDYGTGVRIRSQFQLGDYDLAGKTGTTQNAADGWFMLMHPELVTGAWVGFNDPRLHFRSDFWGQGAHNALLLVGDYFRTAVEADSVEINDVEFPMVDIYADEDASGDSTLTDDGEGRVGW